MLESGRPRSGVHLPLISRRCLDFDKRVNGASAIGSRAGLGAPFDLARAVGPIAGRVETCRRSERGEVPVAHFGPCRHGRRGITSQVGLLQNSRRQGGRGEAFAFLRGVAGKA